VIWQTAEARPAHPETRVHCELPSPVLDYYEEASDPDIVILRRQDDTGLCVEGAGGGDCDLLPPPRGPTQVGTTPGLAFRAAIKLGGEVDLSVAL
jgi:hypothetical protein